MPGLYLSLRGPLDGSNPAGASSRKRDVQEQLPPVLAVLMPLNSCRSRGRECSWSASKLNSMCRHTRQAKEPIGRAPVASSVSFCSTPLARASTLLRTCSGTPSPLLEYACPTSDLSAPRAPPSASASNLCPSNSKHSIVPNSVCTTAVICCCRRDPSANSSDFVAAIIDRTSWTAPSPRAKHSCRAATRPPRIAPAPSPSISPLQLMLSPLLLLPGRDVRSSKSASTGTEG
mmetsp:Transcript_30340/g.67126  ORF Transcript_30340/g.67126 Transcript_30340/m.67126 type:complete len:232 (+) Transcript_30340:281-976(+)